MAILNKALARRNRPARWKFPEKAAFTPSAGGPAAVKPAFNSFALASGKAVEYHNPA
jgi:hypothetical protein